MLILSPDMEAKKTGFLKMIRGSTAEEQKWLIRIILKDLKIGIRHERILKNLHPLALDLFNRCSDLKEVLDTIRKYSVEGTKIATSGFGCVALFKTFRPMLAERLLGKNVMSIYGDKEWIIERKWDGERIICHLDKGEGKVCFYTRNANDYTSNYGAQMTSILTEGVRGLAVILDGEMLAWNAATNTFIPFGSNRTVAQDGIGRHLCYIVFDILLYCDKDGKTVDLTSVPLIERKELLARVIRVESHKLELAQYKTVSDPKECLKLLDEATERREEGLMLKDPNSLYFLAERKKGWYKLKPEYGELSESLDLLVIGAYLGDGSRRRVSGSDDVIDHCSTFLLGIIKGGNAVPFCKVGTGYSLSDLTEMRMKLRPIARRLDSSRLPKWMEGWNPKSGERPDIVIPDISSGFVMEVKAAEIVPSNTFAAGYTLRFPRAVRAIRSDKNWDDAWTDVELHDFVTRAVKIDTNDSAPSDEENIVKKRKIEKKIIIKKGIGGVLADFQDTDTSNIRSIGEIFKGMTFLVMNGDLTNSKADLERFIVANGGSKKQNIKKDSKDSKIIAAKSEYRTVNIAKMSNNCVIHYDWLYSCVKSNKLLPLHPSVILNSTKELEQEFASTLDKWSDSYFDPTTEDTYMNIYTYMNNSTKDLLKKNILSINCNKNSYINNTNYLLFTYMNIYTGYYLYIDDNIRKNNESFILCYKLHGGCICNDICKCNCFIGDFPINNIKKTSINALKNLLNNIYT
eukprot:GHVL01015670.1.p1 GENE.GHVL01015670.1~~GHVL01015670.1.p1  ORF type:complete len:742 (-),score=161.60 GHVL01015670.1:259-2484(-)